MARAPVSKTGGWGFESLHSCQATQWVANMTPLNKRGAWIQVGPKSPSVC
jgi:hypothetical protein